MHASLETRSLEFQSAVLEAARALLIRLGSDEASLEVPTDDGGRLVVEILHFPPPGSRPSEDALTLLPDPVPDGNWRA